MKVWRILDRSTNKLLHGMYPIQGIANTYMIKLAEAEVRKHKLPTREAWADTSKDIVYTTNEYIHKSLGLNWCTVESDYITDEEYRKWKEQKELEEDYEWHSSEEFNLLIDGSYYDLELSDGSAFSSVLYDEDEELFCLNDNVIQVEEVISFRRCY
jgi:hypothetical protein